MKNRIVIVRYNRSKANEHHKDNNSDPNHAPASSASVTPTHSASNAAAGVTDAPLDHADVVAAGEAAGDRISGLVRDVLARLGDAS